MMLLPALMMSLEGALAGLAFVVASWFMILWLMGVL
jgi:hypothetical protein